MLTGPLESGVASFCSGQPGTLTHNAISLLVACCMCVCSVMKTSPVSSSSCPTTTTASRASTEGVLLVGCTCERCRGLLVHCSAWHTQHTAPAHIHCFTSSCCRYKDPTDSPHQVRVCFRRSCSCGAQCSSALCACWLVPRQHTLAHIHSHATCHSCCASNTHNCACYAYIIIHPHAPLNTQPPTCTCRGSCWRGRCCVS